MNELKLFCSVAGDYKKKTLAHSRARRLLKLIGNLLGEEARISTNMGGPAVYGESIYHSNKLYIQLGESGVLYRTVKHDRDYTGGPNRWIKYSYLQSNFENFISTLEKLKDEPS